MDDKYWLRNDENGVKLVMLQHDVLRVKWSKFDLAWVKKGRIGQNSLYLMGVKQRDSSVMAPIVYK